jgi:RHS repeat-associated protein
MPRRVPRRGAAAGAAQRQTLHGALHARTQRTRARGYRGYDPGIGRWLSEDPLGLVDGTNLYAYVRNVPTRLTDADGLQVIFGQIPPWLGPVTAASRQLPLPRTTNNPSGTSQSPMPRVTAPEPYVPRPQPMPSGTDLVGKPDWFAYFMRLFSEWGDDAGAFPFPTTIPPARDGKGNPIGTCPVTPPPPKCTPDGICEA